MSALPMPFEWAGGVMTPVRRFANECDRHFVVGERYILAAQEERSAASHRQYFASLNDIWMSLPDDQAERFPTMTTLRKFALIKCGYANSRQYVAASKAEALRVAAFMNTTAEYSIIVVNCAVVTEWTAMSQNMRTMDKVQFQESKTAVLDYCAGLIGVAPQRTTLTAMGTVS